MTGHRGAPALREGRPRLGLKPYSHRCCFPYGVESSGILEQEDGEFEASLDYTVSSRPSWAVRPNVIVVGKYLCLIARLPL